MFFVCGMQKLAGLAFTVTLATLAALVYEGLVQMTWKVVTSAAVFLFGLVVSVMKSLQGRVNRKDERDKTKNGADEDDMSNSSGGSTTSTLLPAT